MKIIQEFKEFAVRGKEDTESIAPTYQLSESKKS